MAISLEIKLKVKDAQDKIGAFCSGYKRKDNSCEKFMLALIG